ncbi:UNVERIFIED_CONTAM: hypothetical protein HDU68_008368 [Siphonaria sp. JEL0065]|nr:hypothetical protein HDU68_008368 [Siphonaria sp. JEL0065]
MVRILLLSIVPFVLARPIERDQPAAITPGWTVCGGYSAFEAVVVSPYVPPNQITVSVAGSINNTAGITAGLTDFAYTLIAPNGKVLFTDNKSYDTCSLDGITCPIPNGQGHVTFQIPPPTASTSASGLTANSTIHVIDQEGNIALCLNNPSYPV